MYGLINIIKEGKSLRVKNYGGFETRNESSIKLVSQALKGVEKDLQFNIYTEDKPVKNINNLRTFSFSTIDNDYSSVCPDFLFDHWKQVGILDYEEECKKIKASGNNSYNLNKIGWIGSFSTPLRYKLYDLYNSDKNILDIRPTFFKKDGNGINYCDNFMTLEQQVKIWKYLLDIEGNGWSARFKLFLWSGRPVFLIDRPFKEYFYQFLQPWEHYIPVKRDLSDLKQNFEIIEKDNNLYDTISKKSVEFAQKYLSRDYAINYWKSII